MLARLLTTQVWILPKPHKRPGDVPVYSLTLHVGSVVQHLGRRRVRLKDGTIEDHEAFSLQPSGLVVLGSLDCQIEPAHGNARVTKPVDSRHVVNVLGQPVRERDRDHRRKER